MYVTDFTHLETRRIMSIFRLIVTVRKDNAKSIRITIAIKIRHNYILPYITINNHSFTHQKMNY